MTAATKCPKCGNTGPHFVPPSFGDAGFYICDTETPVSDERVIFSEPHPKGTEP